MGMMVRQQFLPAVLSTMNSLAGDIAACKAVAATVPCGAQQGELETLAGYYQEITAAQKKLEKDLAQAEELGNGQEAACFYRDTILPDMDAVRKGVAGRAPPPPRRICPPVRCPTPITPNCCFLCDFG